MAKISVIIPCYQQERFIRYCVESCQRQTVMPDEIIVVDDCSTDKSVDILTTIEGIKLYCLRYNAGVSKARNTGIKESTGDFIVLLDADDMLLPKSIEYRLKVFKEHSEADIVYGNALKCHDDVSYEWCMKHRKELEHYTRPPEFQAINFQTVMYRRRVFEKYGLFYEKLRSKEDKEFITRLGLHRDSPWKCKVKARHVDKDVVFYRRHANSKHKKRVADTKWARETDRIFEDRIRQLKTEGISKENTPWLT